MAKSASCLGLSTHAVA